VSQLVVCGRGNGLLQSMHWTYRSLPRTMAGMSNADRSDSSGDPSANPASPANDAAGPAPASPASPAPAPEGLTPADPGFRRALTAVLFAGIASFQALYATQA